MPRVRRVVRRRAEYEAVRLLCELDEFVDAVSLDDAPAELRTGHAAYAAAYWLRAYPENFALYALFAELLRDDAERRVRRPVLVRASVYEHYLHCFNPPINLEISARAAISVPRAIPLLRPPTRRRRTLYRRAPQRPERASVSPPRSRPRLRRRACRRGLSFYPRASRLRGRS